MTLVEQLAAFVAGASYDELSEAARDQLKIRILDSLGCAIGALKGEPIQLIHAHTEDFGGASLCTLIGGGRTAPDRAAFYNSALVRYLDFNDSFLARGETCHPSDNFGSVLAAGEYAGRSGRDLLTALAVAYQVQCRLGEVAPVRAKGFDHTTQGAYAVAAGVSKALGLRLTQTANAIAIAGTAFNALRVTRTGALSHWKGLAYANTAFGATHAAFLAGRGITGPPEVFEGNKGFMEAIASRFEIDWSKEDLERVTRTIVKKYNAEIHSQSVIEGALELKHEHHVAGTEVDRVEIEIFEVAHKIIGGGEEGDKSIVRTKEQADHSLQYMVAAAILDDQVMPEQYLPERIQINERPTKPRSRGVTEIRGPYYTPMGKHYLEDVLETMGAYVDVLKFAAGSFSLMPSKAVKELLELCHSHNVLVSTGGFIEHVLTQGPDAVTRYIEECKRLGFEIVEVSTGFITIPTDDWLRLVEKVQKVGLKAKPEIGIQFGAGGATAAAELEAEGTRDPEWAISQAKRFVDAGAYMIMIESEGITENVKVWRTDVVARIINALGLEKPMFEAADPEVFAWYMKNYGAEVNLFVDHSQIVQLECLRSGIWGTKSLWGRILTYKG